jgi:quercetin dioxygenase-like cupin family protein
MNSAEKNKSSLSTCMAKGRELISLINYSADSIVSKMILNKPAGTVTLFAFDKGQKLSEHTTPYDAIVQVAEGEAAITIAGEEKQVSAGEIIIMSADVPHAITAKENFKMLLTMIRE